MESLKITDLSDREVLAIVEDVAASDGWSAAESIAKALGIEHERRTQCVGSRLSWIMRLSGTVERHDLKPWWRLTPTGEVVVRGRLSREEERRLEEIDGTKLILVTRHVGLRRRDADASMANLMRREWTHQLSQHG